MYIVVTNPEDKQDMSRVPGARLLCTDELGRFQVWQFVNHPDEIEQRGITVKGMILIQI